MRSNQLSYAPLTDGGKSTMRPTARQVPAALCQLCVCVLLVSLLSACQLRNLFEPASPSPAPPVPTVTPQGWTELAPGLQLHTSLSTGSLLGQLVALRVDPQRYRLRAHYQPGQALGLDDWLDALPGVVAFINANFFESNLHINGLLVADGVAHGQPWLSRGGTLLVRDGLPQLRPSRVQPWRNAPPQQAVQGFPMLVLDGAQAYKGRSSLARRSVVALDSQGHVLLLATPLLGISLADLAAWLVASELDIVSALNLDGGGSTLFFVSSEPATSILSLDAVPALLAVWPEE